jgi:hypothetical protein
MTALSNSQYGIVVLPATIQLCYGLSKLATMLDKRPDLTQKLRKVTNADQGESRKTLVEGTAESIQRAFTMCLTERSTNRNGIGKDGKPEGKKVGIYSFANLVLKLLFQVGRTTTGRVYRDLKSVAVSENAISKPTLHEHFPTLSSFISLFCERTGNLSLLPRPLPILQQPLLSRTALSRICIRAVSRKMSEEKTPHPDLPNILQHDSRPVPIPISHVAP